MHRNVIITLGKIIFTKTTKVIKGEYQAIEEGSKKESSWMVLTNLPIEHIKSV